MSTSEKMPPASNTNISSTSRLGSWLFAGDNEGPGEELVNARSPPKLLSKEHEVVSPTDKLRASCKPRSAPVPNTILDRKALTQALRLDAGLFVEENHIDYLYEHLHRQNYPSLKQFVQDYRKITCVAEHHAADTSMSSDDDTIASLEGWSRATSPRHTLLYHCTHHRIPSKLLDFLEKNDNWFVTTTSRVIEVNKSSNGNLIKLVIELHDGLLVETTIMRFDQDGLPHASVSVSCQVGWDVGCSALCPIESTGFKGNLTAGEILEQVVHAQQVFVGDNNHVEPCHAIRKVSLMESGEPLHNYDEVTSACRALSNKRVWNLGHGRITISTIGIVDRMYDLTRDLPNVVLALGLHAPNQELRRAIVPVAEENAFDELMEALDNHMNDPCDRGNASLASPLSSGRKRRMVMLEYIMMEGKTSSLECAHELGRLCENRQLVVNLIPYIADSRTRDKRSCPSPSHIKQFQSIVSSYGVICNVRLNVSRLVRSKSAVARQIGYEKRMSLRDVPQDMNEMGFWQKLSFIRLCGWNKEALRERQEKRRVADVPKEIFAKRKPKVEEKSTGLHKVEFITDVNQESSDDHVSSSSTVETVATTCTDEQQQVESSREVESSTDHDDTHLRQLKWVLPTAVASMILCGIIISRRRHR